MAKLTASKRASLPRKDFALPGKGEGPKGSGSGSYPIPDASHARNALARSAGKPVAAQVRAKVKAKFPNIGMGGGGTSMAARDKADKAADKKAGIKQGSKADMARDKKAGVYNFEYGSKKPGGGGSVSPSKGAKPPVRGAGKGSSGRAIQGPRGGGGMRRGY